MRVMPVDSAASRSSSTAPAQKPLPAPVTTSAPMDGSGSSSPRAATISSFMAWPTALRLSGSLSVSWATPSEVSIIT